ncbi:MAG: YggS family pyridoxal phosphate-dependent enzyme [Candidatus Omnitrophota bacterium]|nr:YggS family pyridoxal phosphate-dependent enzyme [Candidatus Omnitrophota bacterium]
MIRDNIASLRKDIALICQRLKRQTQEISLVCVTKGATSQMAFEAIQNGIRDIGENRIQLAQKKFLELKLLIKNSNQNFSLHYHMVGHLQTNKVKSALLLFDLIQSVGSLHLAKEIEKQALKLNKTVDILIQVNTSGELSKFGIRPKEAIDLVSAISKLERIKIKGLMTIAPEVDDIEETRPCFRELRILKERITREFKHPQVTMQYLSMGMSNDYRVALEESSNMIRLGRAIFER